MSIFRLPTVRVAALQTRIHQGERERNWQSARALIEQALPLKPDVVVLPEAFATGVNFIILRQMAEPIPQGSICQELMQIATRLSAHVVAGILERGEDDKIYDSAVVLSPQGALLAKYRRRFLWIGERSYITAGDAAAIIRTPLGTLGILLGYDLCFPTACAGFLESDVDIGICPASVFSPLNYNATRLGLARAMDSHCYFVFANSVGFHQFANMAYTGQSAIYADPYFQQVALGVTAADELGALATAGPSQEQLLVAELPVEELARSRSKRLPFKGDAAFERLTPSARRPS